MRTPICDRLGIEFPIFAFSHCRDVVAAVTNAGGFGVLGALAFDAERLETELRWIDEHVGGKPYGVDFAMPAVYVGKGGGAEAAVDNLSAMVPSAHREFVQRLLDDAGVPSLPADGDVTVIAAGLRVDEQGPAQLEVCLQHPGVKMVVNALGPPPPYVIEACHQAGVLVGALAGSRQHAERQVAMGVDVVVAQGTEAGGHCGEISTMVLVPEIVDAVGPDVPVLAAGGIANGRQAAAAMALGAQGAWAGSVWLLTTEADVTPEVAANLLAAGPKDVVRSRSMTGKPARQLRTAWTEAWESPDAPPTLPMPLQGILYAEGAARFSRARTPAFAGSPAGQVIGSIHSIRPARDVVLTMIDEWIEAVQRLSGLMNGAGE